MGLIVQPAAQLIALDVFKVSVKGEVAQHLLCVDLRLAGRYGQPTPGGSQAVEHPRYAVVDTVLVEAYRGEPLPVGGDRLLDESGVLRLKDFAEGGSERRPDEAGQLFGWRAGAAQATQRVLEAFDDPFAGVGQRAVEVEEDVSDGHRPTLHAAVSPCNAICWASVRPLHDALARARMCLTSLLNFPMLCTPLSVAIRFATNAGTPLTPNASASRSSASTPSANS